MSGEKDLEKLLVNLCPFLAKQEYVFCTFADFPNEKLIILQPLATFKEKEGFSSILEKKVADQYQLDYHGVFKCITLNVHSSLEAVGLTAAVSTKLARGGISANMVAAYYHDHIFVPAERAEEAIKLLTELRTLPKT